MAREYEEPTGRFGVFVENPNDIYSIVLNDMVAGRGYRNKTKLIRDKARPNGTYLVSQTQLESALVDSEETLLYIMPWGGISCVIEGSISLSEEALSRPPYGFFDPQKVEGIRQLMTANGIPVDWDAEFQGLEARKGNEVVVSINFGFESPSEKRFVLENQLDYLERFSHDPNFPQEIIAHAQKRLQEQQTNKEIGLLLTHIRTQEGGIGVKAVSFRSPEVFVENLRFYARVYESLIRTLHQSSRTEEPQAPVIYSPASIKRKD